MIMRFLGFLQALYLPWLRQPEVKAEMGCVCCCLRHESGIKKKNRKIGKKTPVFNVGGNVYSTGLDAGPLIFVLPVCVFCTPREYDSLEDEWAASQVAKGVRANAFESAFRCRFRKGGPSFT